MFPSDEPIQSPVTLGISFWDNSRPPAIGDFIKAPKGRTAYRVITFTKSREGSQMYGRVKCWRVRPADIPEGATVWNWEWRFRG